jgi:hypothetical protein
MIPYLKKKINTFAPNKKIMLRQIEKNVNLLHFIRQFAIMLEDLISI